MHQDIEKLLFAAKEKGSITEKQREIIINKAQQLDEDIAVLEFMLEDIPVRKGVNEKLKKKKCPNCGAIVGEMELKCPECGYTFQNESEATMGIRDIIKETERKFQLATNDDLKISIISSFSVPYTSNALIQAYEYAYGRYVQTQTSNNINYASAWLGKCKELYNLIRSQSTIDEVTQRWIDNHKDILEENIEKKKKKNNTINMIGSIIILIVMFSAIVLYTWLDK